MNKLSSKNYVRELLQEHGLYAKKHFGQNFLTDAHVLSKIVDAAKLDKNDLVLEIGPGLGVLTSEMAKLAGAVCAIEIDKELVQILNHTVAASYKNVSIHNEDILKADVKKIIAGTNYTSLKVVANLPYYITTPVIFGLFEQGLPIASMTVMVQKEVADRFLAAPSTKAYGIPSITLALYGKCELVANVPPHSFHPRPDVHSAVIKITAHTQDAKIDHKSFVALVKAAFANRRKTLVNNLSTHLKLTKENAASLIQKAGLPETIRGEALTFDEFAALAKELIVMQN